MSSSKIRLFVCFICVLSSIALSGCTSEPASPPPPARVKITWTEVSDSKNTTPTPITNRALQVFSNEGLEFLVGVFVDISASVEDQQAYKNNFNVTDLSSLLDKSFRGFARNFLVAEFSPLTLQEGCLQKVEIFQRVRTKLAGFYQSQGVTINDFAIVRLQQKVVSFTGDTPATFKFLGFRSMAFSALACDFGIELNKY